jgi:hypothetical protein
MNKRRRSASVALAAGLLTSGARAASVNRFDPTVQVGGSTLLLNGSGTRYRVMFKVYDMALYLPAKGGNAAAIIDMQGPKRLAFISLRDIPGTDLGLAFIKGLQANSPSDTVQRHTLSSTRLIEIFSGKSKLASGDTFAMDYLPGKGTQFYIQGQPQGAPVGDAEYFSMVLRIWLGPQPVDTALRDGLLGVEARSGY